MDDNLIPVLLKRRSFLERLIKFPIIFLVDYRIFRRTNPFWESVYAAFLVSKTLLRNYGRQ